MTKKRILLISLALVLGLIIFQWQLIVGFSITLAADIRYEVVKYRIGFRHPTYLPPEVYGLKKEEPEFLETGRSKSYRLDYSCTAEMKRADISIFFFPIPNRQRPLAERAKSDSCSGHKCEPTIPIEFLSVKEYPAAYIQRIDFSGDYVKYSHMTEEELLQNNIPYYKTHILLVDGPKAGLYLSIDNTCGVKDLRGELIKMAESLLP